MGTRRRRDERMMRASAGSSSLGQGTARSLRSHYGNAGACSPRATALRGMVQSSPIDAGKLLECDHAHAPETGQEARFPRI